MSMDNGHVIRQNAAGKFVLQSYNASADGYPELDEAIEGPHIFDTLEVAVLEYSVGSQEYMGKYYDEYGLSVLV